MGLQSTTTTAQLRTMGLTAIERTHGAPVRIDTRKHFYRCPDGTEFLLRTNRVGILIIQTDGTSADARTEFDAIPFVGFVTPTAVYLIPGDVIGRDARADHRVWLEQAHTKGNNQTWQMIFDHKPDLCRGYAERYRNFVI